MTDTVAVAIITASATLIASAVASGLSAWFNLRATSQLRDTQLQVFESERAERRAADHRSVRLDVYSRFLAEALAAADVVREARESGLTEAEFQARLRRAKKEVPGLVKGHALVRVVGPGEMFEAADRVRAALETELAEVDAVHNGSSHIALEEASKQRRLAVGALAALAESVLGGSEDSP